MVFCGEEVMFVIILSSVYSRRLFQTELEGLARWDKKGGGEQASVCGQAHNAGVFLSQRVRVAPKRGRYLA